MNSKLLGGTLLLIGTTIGAGMLALPVATAEVGFWGAMAQLVVCWGIMAISAFLFLEVNLWLPPNSNLISMAGATLGKAGQTITWVVYLLLLYSIICAYIAGGGDLSHYILRIIGINLSLSTATLLFTLLFATVVYLGIRSVDYVNRGLMFGKMGAYVLLVLFIFPFISLDKLSGGTIKYITSSSALTVTGAAFGSIIIIPSLRTYFGNDIKSLRKAVFLGTFIPLLCYIAWDMVIMGVIPLEGQMGLKKIMTSQSSNSDLVTALSTLIKTDAVTTLARFFTSICMATSFLSISLSLSDFLADGFGVQKKGFGNILVYGATFIPPLCIVNFYPDAFIRSIGYAGICCFILMVILPVLMAWCGRYRYNLSPGTQFWGGKPLLIFIGACGTLLLAFGIEGIL